MDVSGSLFLPLTLLIMNFRTAILIDAGFYKKAFEKTQGRSPVIGDMTPFTDSVMRKVQTLTPPNCTDILYRTYYYDCRPYDGTQTRPDGKVFNFATSPTFRVTSDYLKDLKTHPQLALRLGELSFDGWKINPKNPAGSVIPDFKQKSVDMKIGLDIAWMASKNIVDKIVLVTADSDFVSPMKLARKEGKLVYLETMGQTTVKMNLKEHADFIL